MGFAGRIFLFAILITTGYIAGKMHDIIKPLPLPKLDLNRYWGPDKKINETSTNIRPFLIHYPLYETLKLKKQLSEPLVLQEPLEGEISKNGYGLKKDFLVKFINYWRDDYLPKWLDKLTKLNYFPHFKTNIQGLDIHFIQIKPYKRDSAGKRVVPLLLLHGWPGSVRDFYDILPIATKPLNDLGIIFEVIVPSLPGFGWSDAPTKPGFGIAETAIVLRNLMIRLGHDQFYIQGGDLGSIIGSHIATIFPENVIGFHSNFCYIDTPLSIFKNFFASLYPTAFIPKEYEHFVFPLNERYRKFISSIGHVYIQATRPDTIGIALTGNPVGLAAYILGINQPELTKFNYEAMADLVMIYYSTNTIGTSVRLFGEMYSEREMGYQLNRVPVQTPTACARFPNNLIHHLDWELSDKYRKLIQSTYYLEGGNNPVLDAPEILFNDLKDFVKKTRNLLE